MALPVTVKLSIATTTTGAPYTVAHAFKKGDVPSGSYVTANLPNFQCVVKNTWPDGSLKIAVLSGLADLNSSAPTDLILSKTTTAPTGTPLTTTDLKATGITASFTAGTFGSASWATTDWDTPFQSWISGPIMSSWVYRKPIGSDPHLVAWLEVRLYSSGAVDVLPWVENGYLNVAGSTNKSETYTFSLGGTQRFSGAIDIPHHCRTPLINGSALSYWLGTDPGVTPKHDTSYMQKTEQVPTYSAVVATNAAVAQALITTWSPLDKGNIYYYNDYMRSPGYGPCIGLLPEYDVLYLTCNSPNTYGAVVRNGFAAGRYPIHYRDETTNRPLRFSQYPKLVLSQSGSAFGDLGGSTAGQYTPTPSGTAPPAWDTPHSPSLGYMAYLLTGRFYFMEEAQFIPTVNYLGKGDPPVLRDGSKGLVKSCPGAWQVRSAGWMWRSLAMALNITPDNDTLLRTEFINSIQYNIDDHYNQYVAQANNPYGWVQGENYNGATPPFMDASWMQDFVTASWGFSLAMGLPLSSTYTNKMDAFFRWKAKSAIQRLGPQGSFWYVNGAPYTMSISPVNVPDFATGTGPWHATDADCYNATYTPAPTWLSNTEGVLSAEIMPGANSMWGNLMPAITYAVRHGVTGAAAAYNRLTSASNYNNLATAFNTTPVWSVAVNTDALQTSKTFDGLAIRVDTTDILSGSIVCGDSGFGPLGSSYSSTGGNGGSPVANDLQAADLVKSVRWQIITRPTGTFTPEDDGTFVHTGSTSTSFTYRLFVANQQVTPDGIVYLNYGSTQVLPGSILNQVRVNGITLSRISRAISTIGSVFNKPSINSFTLTRYARVSMSVGSITNQTTVNTLLVSRIARVGLTLGSVINYSSLSPVSISLYKQNSIGLGTIFAVGGKIGGLNTTRFSTKSIIVGNIVADSVVGAVTSTFEALKTYNLGTIFGRSQVDGLMTSSPLRLISLGSIPGANTISPLVAVRVGDIGYVEPKLGAAHEIIFNAKLYADLSKKFSVRDKNGDWVDFANFKGMDNKPIMVKYRSFVGDTPFYSGELNILADTRAATIRCPAEKIMLSRSNKIYFDCTALDKNTDVSVLLFRGVVNLV